MIVPSALLVLSITAAPGASVKATASSLAAHELARFDLRGTVRDHGGKAIPGATVAAILGDTQVSAETDANGVFRFSLPAGRYRIRVTAPGFAASIRQDVDVGAGQAPDLAIVLGLPAAAKDHVGAAPPPPILIAPPPPVMLEEEIDTAPPPPPPPPPPPVAGDGKKAAPPAAAADGHETPSGLYWNEWLEGKKHERLRFVPEPPPDVAPSDTEPTDLIIDLSLADLSRLAGGGAASAGITPDLAVELAAENRVQVLAVAVGDALELEPTKRVWQELPINFDKLRSTSVTLPTAPMDDDAFRNFARTASVLEVTAPGPQPTWSPILLQVHGIKKGCGAVALSVWDDRLRRPLDQQFFPVAVGPVKCGPMPGGSGLSAALLRRYGSDSADYDAAIHVFEMPRSGGTSAVFVARGDPRPRVWKLEHPLSALPDAMGPDLGLARDAESYDVKEASRTLMTELFLPGNTAAQAALDMLRRFRETPGKSIYARIVRKDGTNLPLPLGLIDVGGGVPLGSVATIATPFPHDRTEGPASGCISQRVMISDTDTFTGILPRPSGGPLVGSAKAMEFFGSPSSGRVALVLLGHHAKDTEQLVFENNEAPRPITTESLTRRFDNGVGFLMLCGVVTTPRTRGSMTWLEKFGEQGIGGAVASPFEIEADTAQRFLTAVQQVLSATPATSSIRLADLYAAAIRRMDARRAWEAFEYVVIGDGSIRLCGEGS